MLALCILPGRGNIEQGAHPLSSILPVFSARPRLGYGTLTSYYSRSTLLSFLSYRGNIVKCHLCTVRIGYRIVDNEKWSLHSQHCKVCIAQWKLKSEHCTFDTAKYAMHSGKLKVNNAYYALRIALKCYRLQQYRPVA